MFYDRLQAACEMRNKALTTVVRKVASSSGMIAGWKAGGFPRADVVVKLADELSVSTDYLLERVDFPDMYSINSRVLDDQERDLIDSLRSAQEPTRDLVYKISKAALSSGDTDEESTTATVDYFSPNGGKIARKTGFDSVLAANPKLRQMGVRKGSLAFRGVEGKAAAGPPRTAVRDEGVHILVPVKYTGEQYFIVQAEGDSMTGVVNDGDYCVFNKRGHFDDGRICLVQADGATDEPDAMIKRVYRRGDRVELRSENRKYPPRFYPVEEVVLMGELVAVLSPDSCQLPER
jgi:SOS-response transcriptional repressor LexA/transcriptional regulator with XRE-family HTH domain